MELTFWICLNFLILNKHAAADSCIYPAAAAATAVVLADSAPCRSTYTCEPLSAPLVTGSQHLRRCNVGKPQQDVMSHSRQKVLTRLLLSASVSQDKTRLFFCFFSQKLLCCVFCIPRSDFLFLNWSSYGWEVGCFQHKCQNRCWQQYISAKPQKCWNFTFFFIVKLFSLGFNFQFHVVTTLCVCSA